MVWDVTEIQQEIVLLPELPDVPSRTQDPQSVYNTKAFNFRAAERELQQKFNINVPLLNVVLKSSTVILPNMDAIENVAGNMVNITAVAAHSSDITTVAVNMPAVLDAPNSATAAGQSALDAAASAGQAATSATGAGNRATSPAAFGGGGGSKGGESRTIGSERKGIGNIGCGGCGKSYAPRPHARRRRQGHCVGCNGRRMGSLNATLRSGTDAGA